jgi:NADH-quinone oxidoreductase subunit C
MTAALKGRDAAAGLEQRFPESVTGISDDGIAVRTEDLSDIIAYLKEAPEFEFNYLSGITAVDYLDYFEVVYHLTSMAHNHSLVVRTRCTDRDNPSVPSITGLYRGAAIQEREVYDLMGIRFEGHRDLKRLFLWDGFEGHPLRKDYLL